MPIRVRIAEWLRKLATTLGGVYHKSQAEVLSEMMELGTYVWMARQIPRLHEGHEWYGEMDGKTLARTLRVVLAPVIDLLIRHNELPIVMLSQTVERPASAQMSAMFPSTAAPPPPPSTAAPQTIEVDDTALDGFSGGLDEE